MPPPSRPRLIHRREVTAARQLGPAPHGGTSVAAAAIVRSNKHHLRAFLERTARRARLQRPSEVAFQLMVLAEGALVTAAIDGDPDVPRRARAAAQLLIDAATR